MPFQGIFPTRGSSQPRSLSLQVDSLPSEPPEKPKNTGVAKIPQLQQVGPRGKNKTKLPDDAFLSEL